MYILLIMYSTTIIVIFLSFGSLHTDATTDELCNVEKCPSVNIKVGIYPYIPDIDEDNLQGLMKFVKDEFEARNPDISLTISNNWDPYDVDEVVKYFDPNSEDRFDVLEIDTILLGEIVEKEILQPLQLENYGPSIDNYFKIGLEAVNYKGSTFAVPTLHCASFLMELVSNTVENHENLFCTLEKGEYNVTNLMQALVLGKLLGIFNGASPLIGDFRGSWTLPSFYLDAYIDKHGKESVQEGVNSQIDESNVLFEMKSFMHFDRGADGTNKGISNKYDSAGERNADICKSDHILLYGYSEWLSQVLSDRNVQEKEYTCHLYYISTSWSKKQSPYIH